MNVTIRAAAAAGCLLAVALAGCSARPASTARPSVQACTAYGITAIERHVTVTTRPAACRGLSRAQINFAIGRAIFAVAGSGHRKSAWRRRAAADGALLAGLITAPQAPPAAPPQRAPAGAAAPAAGRSRALAIATLISWLLAVGSGGYMLGRWLIRGGLRQHRVSREGLAPAVIFGHFGLATAGLAVWCCYLVAGWTALAWAAVALLLPVTGLGISTVILWVPYPTAGRPGATGGRLAAPAQDVIASRLSDAVLTRALTDQALASRLVDDVVDGAQASPARGTRRSRGHAAALIPAGHGLAAMATILLAVLTAVGT